jgi:hypothetical protein
MRAFFKKDEALSQKFGPIITPLSAFYVDDINFDAKPGIFSHPVLQVSRLVGQASYFHLTVCVCVRGADRVRVCAGGLKYLPTDRGRAIQGIFHVTQRILSAMNIKNVITLSTVSHHATLSLSVCMCVCVCR